MIFIVAAMSRNSVIGKDGGLPWPHNSLDMRRFRTLTMGKACIAGRKTTKSLGGSLKGRLLVTLGHGYCKDIDTALNVADLCEGDTAIIGGAQVYKAFLDSKLVDKIYLTVINKDYEGDTYFPVESLKSYSLDNTEVVEDLMFRTYSLIKA